MRIEAVQREVISSGNMQVARATIKATPKIFNIFEKMTYSDIPVAIARELVANGVDAHTAAGIPDRPVEVTMPTNLEPVFKVRDYGIGMAHDFVMGPFMAYTDGSTKDSSNDQIGGFGIGSKSPFAYTDQFTLRVVHEGVLSVYTMFKDDEGIPSVGLQGQTTTDEHNGVEISFPVDDKDQETFRAAAQKALQYFQPLPIVRNGELKAPDYSYVGTGWALRRTAGELGVIMGGVRYPVSTSNLEYTLRNSNRLSPLLNYGIDLTLPIGSVGVATSREGLTYDDNTSNVLSKALLGILDDVINTFATFFDDAPTLWDAMVRLHREVQGTKRSGSYYSSYDRTPRQQLMEANSKYKGAPLKTSIGFKGMVGDVGSAWSIERSRRSQNLKTPKWQTLQDIVSISPGHTDVLIIDDLPQNSASRIIQRVNGFFETRGSLSGANLVLRAGGDNTDKAQIAKLLSLLGDPTDVVYTSSILPPARVKSAKTDRPRVRMWTHNGKNDRWSGSEITNLTPAHSKRDAITEVPYKDQPDAGIMVVMNSFDLPLDFYKHMGTKLVAWDELVFVNEGDAPKIAKNFKRFENVFAERLKAALAKFPELPQRLALLRDDNLSLLFSFIRTYRYKLVLTPQQQKKPFGRIISLYDTYIVPLDREQILLSTLVTSEYPKGVDTAMLVKNFGIKQPDAKLILSLIQPQKEGHIELFLRNL